MGCCFSSPVRNHSPVNSNGIQDKPLMMTASTLPVTVSRDHHQIGPPAGELRSITRATEVPAVELRSSTRAADVPAAELRSSTRAADVPAANVETPANLKVYTVEELRIATRNFRPDTVLGEGGFGTVFKGWIDEKTLAPAKVNVGIPVAVKKSNPNSEQGLREWMAEVEFLGKFRHPNLVKLVGYCREENQFLLVYEYMHKGSLEAHLFSNKEAQLLSWDTRLKIAIGAAKGLVFLHNTEKKVIYRDFKASNILLDSDFGAKLSDFGLAKQGPINGKSHVSTRIVGTYGYAAPEYVATGHLYIKSDVYCFGVMVLELLTGQRVVDVKRPARQSNLVEWAKPILQDKKKLKRIVDPRLERQFPSKAVIQTAELISCCLENDPKNRPSMDDVLEILENIIAIKMSPRESKHHPKDQPDTHSFLHQ